MSDVIRRMLVMHTKISINCDQVSPVAAHVNVIAIQCTDAGASVPVVPVQVKSVCEISRPITISSRHSSRRFA